MIALFVERAGHNGFCRGRENFHNSKKISFMVYSVFLTVLGSELIIFVFFEKYSNHAYFQSYWHITAILLHAFKCLGQSITWTYLTIPAIVSKKYLYLGRLISYPRCGKNEVSLKCPLLSVRLALNTVRLGRCLDDMY